MNNDYDHAAHLASSKFEGTSQTLRRHVYDLGDPIIAILELVTLNDARLGDDYGRFSDRAEDYAIDRHEGCLLGPHQTFTHALALPGTYDADLDVEWDDNQDETIANAGKALTRMAEDHGFSPSDDDKTNVEWHVSSDDHSSLVMTVSGHPRLRSGLPRRISKIDLRDSYRYWLSNVYSAKDYLADAKTIDYAIDDWNRHEDFMTGQWTAIQPMLMLHVAGICLEPEYGTVFDSDDPDQASWVQMLLDHAIGIGVKRLNERIVELDRQRQLLQAAEPALAKVVIPTFQSPIHH